MNSLQTAEAFINAFYNVGEEFCLFLKDDEYYDEIRAKEKEFQQEEDYFKRKDIDRQIQEQENVFRGKLKAYHLRESFERQRVYKEEINSFKGRYEFYQRMNLQRFAPCLYINSGIAFINNTRTGELKPRSVNESIKRINAQFYECDHTDIEKQREIIKALPINPSIIVKTGRSLHVYFLLKQIDSEQDNNDAVQRFRAIQKVVSDWIFDNFGERTDLAMLNRNRAMRIPGFNYAKLDEPLKVELESFDSSVRYTQQQLCEAFGVDMNKMLLEDRIINRAEYSVVDDSLRELVKKHLYQEGYASYDYGMKIHCNCCHLDHEDEHASAVVYLDSMNHYCFACGTTPVEEIAEELGWDDVAEVFNKRNTVLNKTVSMTELALRYGMRL